MNFCPLIPENKVTTFWMIIVHIEILYTIITLDKIEELDLILSNVDLGDELFV